MSVTKPPRSAEQTARLLLSNAFRYDTWECATARKEVLRAGGEAVTVQLTFHAVERQDLPPQDPRVEAVNLSLFDPERCAFVGAAYTCARRSLTVPLVFQATPKQLLVIETLVRDTRADAPLEQMRVTHWGACPVEKLGQPSLLELRPGTGQLLLLDPALWPAVSTNRTAAVGAVSYKCRMDEDPALAQLMRELVPPGVFVTEAFTRATPRAGGSSFRLVINAIEVTGTSQESMEGITDPNSDWAVAAVAHNGYQQLGPGAEVPLILDNGKGGPGPASASPPSSTSSLDSSSYGYSSGSSSAARPRSAKGKAAQAKDAAAAVLRSELPLEVRGLPVHAATSLVLAIRRRTRESPVFAVVGFCVFPLCMMPMQNRDIRVENLPALRGPFSCEDARMLMVDAASPYGRVPIALTLTVEYHDVAVSADTTAVGGQPLGSPHRIDATAALGEERQGSSSTSRSSLASSLTSRAEGAAGGGRREGAESGEQPPSSTAPMGMAILSTSVDSLTVGPGAAGAPASTHGLPRQKRHAPRAGDAQAAGPAAGEGIIPLLCSIMEELQRVRETQEVLLRQTAPLSSRDPRQAMSPEMVEQLGRRLAGTSMDLVDLAPRPLAVSWAARRAMVADLQPILHPTRGTILDDNAPAPPGVLPASLFGIRFEGATLDTALAMPEDVCVMFSFGPLAYQQVGPMRATSVHKSDDGATESFKLYDDEGRGGKVWFEPADALASAAMAKFKEGGGNAIIYAHVYDALTMFYVATASLPLTLFHRPFNAEAAVTAVDVPLQRDFAMTEQTIPDKVFPVMRYAGQLHVSAISVGVPGPGAGGAALKSSLVQTPSEEEGLSSSEGSALERRVVVAKRLPRTEGLGAGLAMGGPPAASAAAADTAHPDGSVVTPTKEGPTPAAPTSGSPLHWQRAAYVRQQLAAKDAGGGAVLLPGVPAAHVQAAQREAEMEYELRYAERMRNEAKSRAIAAALVSRMTVHHRLTAVAYRPETVRTPFQNPHSVPMQFFVEVPLPADQELCGPPAASASFFLGPRERTEVPLTVRVHPSTSGGPRVGDTRTVRARICSERREVVRYLTVDVTLAAPLVDRRYEIFGAAGSVVSKRVFSRLFSSASFPVTASQSELLRRMHDLCTFAATSSRTGRTQVETNAVLDPVTQTHVTAWEEATIRTTVPSELGRQRTEYVTLFYDADMTRVFETWELCIFACECLTTREIAWGQTTAIGLPAAGTEAMYCDSAGTTVEHTGSSYVLAIKPKEVGTVRMLIHTLMNDGNLRKTLMTVPVVSATPTFTQTLEVSLEEAARGPLFRRLTFTHHGDRDEVFQVHHNYRYQLKVSPQKFALAPRDSQFITIQLDSLFLPPGQLEGRWPMWIFINDARDKTVESYLLQVVLRAHAVVALPEA